MYRSLFQKRPAIFIEPAKRSYPIYIHSYMHTYIYTNIHTYIHTNKLTYIHTYTHTYIHMYIQIYIPTHKHTHWVSKTDSMSQMEGCKEREKQILQVVLTHNDLSLSLSLSLQIIRIFSLSFHLTRAAVVPCFLARSAILACSANANDSATRWRRLTCSPQ